MLLNECALSLQQQLGPSHANAHELFSVNEEKKKKRCLAQ
jgi:hypothetical protein